ncbi:MAG: adenine nucleotide alpha hydrolase family protein [Gammaproteobacteria bacterium]
MDDIKNVLLITNSAENDEINQVKSAFMDAAKQGMRIKLSLVHVIPNLPTCYFSIPSMAQLAEQYYTEAKLALAKAGEELGIAKKDQWLITGRIKTEVLRLANKLGTQFILASSHSIQDLHKALSTNKQRQHTQIKNINSLVASNF